MARAIDAIELEDFPYSESAGTEEQISEWVEECGLDKVETEERAKRLCWKVLEGFINIVKTAPTLLRTNESLTPCDVCGYGPPSSFDGKPCSFCPAESKENKNGN